MYYLLLLNNTAFGTNNLVNINTICKLITSFLITCSCCIMTSCDLRLWSAGSTKAGGDINSDSSSDEEEEEEQGERRPVSQSLTQHNVLTLYTGVKC